MTAFAAQKFEMTRIVAFLLILLASATQGFAWGREGHKVVAIIAESRLTPEAHAEILRLLASENQPSLASVATWADAVKSLKIPKQPSHSVRLPLDNSPFDRKRDCKQNMCVIGAIEASMETLANKDAPTGARMMALKYLVHLVGDVHQPLHASKDGGSEPVVFKGETLSLHKVWDTKLIEAQKLDATAMAGLIDSSEMEPVRYGTPVDWALESRALSRDVIFPQIARLRSPEGVVLPKTYAMQNWHIVKMRLHEAGWRLAEVLNGCFPSRVATSE